MKIKAAICSFVMLCLMLAISPAATNSNTVAVKHSSLQLTRTALLARTVTVNRSQNRFITPATVTPTTSTTIVNVVAKAAKAKVTATATTVTTATTAKAITSCGAHIMNRAEAHSCWDALIGSYNWPRALAFNIMYCESQGNRMARNRHSSATGLMQILNGPTDAQANVALAYSMYRSRGFQPWTASKGCW